jgi:hypothetical protein
MIQNFPENGHEENRENDFGSDQRVCKRGDIAQLFTDMMTMNAFHLKFSIRGFESLATLSTACMRRTGACAYGWPFLGRPGTEPRNWGK